jgi:hypothetical protein
MMANNAPTKPFYGAESVRMLQVHGGITYTFFTSKYFADILNGTTGSATCRYN